MKKLIISLLILVGFVMQVSAYDFQSGNLLYTINSTEPPTVRLVGHADGTAAQGELVIPETVEYDGVSYTVTIIGKNAFNGCRYLEGNLLIPNTIVEIMAGAFCDCVGFTGDLVIPNSVIKINNDYSGQNTVPGTFERCTGFDGSLVLSNSLEIIGDAQGGGCFCGCVSLIGELVLPNSLLYIGNSAFESCSGFTGALVIPESVFEINDYAFAYCTGIEDVVFPNVPVPFDKGTSLFSGCSSLTSIVIPEGWTGTGQNTFSYCSNLQNVRLPESLEIIDSDAFSNCTNLESIDFPDSLNEIAVNAFLNCTGLSGTIAISARKLYRLSFASCTGIRHLVLGEHLDYISELAFKDTNIETIMVKAVVPPELDGNPMGPYNWHFDRDLPVTVPCGTMEEYLAAEGWREFTNMVEGVTYLFSAIPADDNAGSVTVLKEASCDDETVQVLATPGFGYEFMFWEANGIQVSNENPYSFELEEDTELVAFFSPNGVAETIQTLSVYPNPAKDLIRIEGLMPAEVQLFDALGQSVTIKHDTNEISVIDLPDGLYVLRIIDSDGLSFSKRITVVR